MAARLIAVLIVVGAGIVASVLTAREYAGLEELTYLLVPAAYGLSVLWATPIAIGLWRGRRWARWLGLASFVPAAGLAGAALVDTARRIAGDTHDPPPFWHLAAPGVMFVGSSVVALLLALRAPERTTRPGGNAGCRSDTGSVRRGRGEPRCSCLVREVI